MLVLLPWKKKKCVHNKFTCLTVIRLFHQQPVGASQRSDATQTSCIQAQELRFPVQEQQPQPGDGNQASGWSGSFERLGQDAGQRTALRPLSMRSPQAEDYRLRCRSNFPTEEEGQDADQEYRRRGLQNRAIPIRQKENVIEHFCGTQELQSGNENFRRQVVQLWGCGQNPTFSIVFFLPQSFWLRNTVEPPVSDHL